MKGFRVSQESKISRQFSDAAPITPTSHDSPAARRQLPVPPTGTPDLQESSRTQHVQPSAQLETFTAASKDFLQGVPGMLNTIQNLRALCDENRFGRLLEELQILLFQDLQWPNERAVDKLVRMEMLLAILSRTESGALDQKLRLRLFEMIKRIASDAMQNKNLQQLFSSSQQKIFDPLHEHQRSLEAKLFALARHEVSAAGTYDPDSDVFLIDKILYNIETAFKLLDGNLAFVKARTDKAQASKEFTELLSKVGGAATCDGESIGWLVGKGVSFAWRIASKASTGALGAQILIIERYNDLILKQPRGIVDPEQARMWVSDLSGIMTAKFKEFRPHKDWLVLYGCIECLLNIAFRFPEVQQNVLPVLSQHPNFHIKSSYNPWKATKEAFRDTTDFQRRITYKFAEALSQLALWGDSGVRTAAQAALSEHRDREAKVSLQRSTFLRFFLEQSLTNKSDILSLPAAASFSWAERIISAAKILLAQEELKEANAILRIMQQQFQSTGTARLNPTNLVEFAWLHLPQEVIHEFESGSPYLPDLTEDALKRVFVRILQIAFSSKLKSIRVPDHLGLVAQDSEQNQLGPHGDKLVQEDIITDPNSNTWDSRTGSEASASESGEMEGGKSSYGGKRRNSSLSEEEPVGPPFISADEIAAVRESIAKIASHIERGAAPTSKGNERNVVALGVTGCGKSTLVNALAGCTMRTLSQKEADDLCLSRDAVTVKLKSEGGARNPVTAIGNNIGQSETEVLRAVEIECNKLGRSFLLWDPPGFSDTNGPEINIANAVNLTKLLQSSQSAGLITLVVLDAHSLESGRGALLKDTVQILVQLFGGANKQLDPGFLASTLFCVTKAPDSQRHSLHSLRQWIVLAGQQAGLELEGFREQILIFDPLNRNDQGCGPEGLRHQLLSTKVEIDKDRVVETSLTDSDLNLLTRISHVLAEDIVVSLEKGDFSQVKDDLRLFSSLNVISNHIVSHHFGIVSRRITETTTKWSLTLKHDASKFTLEARRKMRDSLARLKRAQVLDDVLPASLPRIPISKAYAECYTTVETAERERQQQEKKELEGLFTKAVGNIRTALGKVSETAPEFFAGFNAEKWGCDDCVRHYASVQEVQLLKTVLEKAREYQRGRMPDQLFVFADQGDLAALIAEFERRILQLFLEAQRKGRATQLGREFDAGLHELQSQMTAALQTPDVEFYAAETPRVQDLQTLVFKGLDPSAQNLHKVLLDLKEVSQQGSPEMYNVKKAELKEYFQDVNRTAIGIRVAGASMQMKEMQDAFADMVQRDIGTWAPTILGASNPDVMLRDKLKLHYPNCDTLWAIMVNLPSLPTVSTEIRDLRARQKTTFDNLWLAAENYAKQIEAEKIDVETKIRGGIERLVSLSFEAVKQEHAHLKRKRLLVDEISTLADYGFEPDLVREVEELLDNMSRIDPATYQSLVDGLEGFLEQLRERAIAESAAAKLRTGYESFENNVRSRLSTEAQGILSGECLLEVQLEDSVTDYKALWEQIRARNSLPAVSDTAKALKREERLLLKRLFTEADQFLKCQASDRKQRDAKFDGCLVNLKAERDKVVRQEHGAIGIMEQLLTVSNLAKLEEVGFDRECVSELLSLMAVLKNDDQASYARRCSELEDFLQDLFQLAFLWATVAVYRDSLRKFQDHIRAAMNDKAQQLAAGGRAAVDCEFAQHVPEFATLSELLLSGPQCANPSVQSLRAEVMEEKDSILGQLEREAQDHIKNAASDRKQVHTRFSALVLQIQNNSEAVQQHCQALSRRPLSVENIAALHQYGFDEQTVRELGTLLRYIAENDQDAHPERCAELRSSFDGIQNQATDCWAEALKAQVMKLLEESQDQLHAKIDSVAADIVNGTLSVEQELITSSIKDSKDEISSFSTPGARRIMRALEREITKSIEGIQRLAGERLKLRAAQEKGERREAMMALITKIVARLHEHQRQDQLELVKAFDELLELDGSSTRYSEMVQAVKSGVESLASSTEVERFLSTENFVGLSARVQMFDFLLDRGRRHFEVNGALLFKAVNREMKKLHHDVLEELHADIESDWYLKFTRVRYFCKVYDNVKETFGNMQQNWDYIIEEALKSLRKMLGRLRSTLQEEQRAAGPRELHQKSLSKKSQLWVAKLLIKGYGVCCELKLAHSFQSAVQDQVIGECTSVERYHIGSALMDFIKDHPSEEDGVKEMARAIIDKFPAFKSFNVELFNAKAGAVKFEVALGKLRCEPPSNNKKKLQEAYDAYIQQYDSLVNHIVQDAARFPESEVQKKIKKHAQSLKKHAHQLGSKVSEFGALLGLVCGLWTYLSRPGSGLEKRQVTQPHSTQILGILRLLALDQQRLENHLIQIDTGEGKSIALGFTASLLALLGFRVDVVCYSEYLSQRDYNSFRELFSSLDVASRISYSDFDTLSNRIMTQGTREFPDMRAAFLDFLRGKKHQPQGGQAGERVLLMDEVDVFFSRAFYGRTFNPAATIDASEGFQLIKHVWDNRERLSTAKQDDALRELQESSPSQQLQSKYPSLSTSLLRGQIIKMLHAAKKFPEIGPPRLDAYPAYVVDKKKHRIGYEDSVSGVPSFTVRFGYVTAFTYLYCVQEKQLNLQDVQEEIKMKPRCGSLLYSQIPRFYTVCLGMTGTLDCLTSVQNNLLQKFNFNVRTFLPSTFHRKALNAQATKESAQTVVEVGSWNEYFEALKKDIEEKLDAGRATLVVFADSKKLDRFASEIQLRPPTMSQYTTPLELSDRLTGIDRESVVMKAIRRYQITLMTRSYGRGTDFVCRDEGLVKNGGVHLIVTFYPDDESENKQINGRTCRQDNPGTAKKILFEEDLNYLSATEKEKKREGAEWDEYLATRRMAVEAERYSKMDESEKEGRVLHDETMKAFEAVKAGRFDLAARLFQIFMDDGARASVSGQGFHIVLALDQSGSMKGERWNAVLAAVDELVNSRISAGGADKVSIVVFDNSAVIGCEQVDVQHSPETCLRTISKYGGTSFAAGLKAAHEVLQRGCQCAARQYLLLMSDGKCSDGHEEMKAIAEEFSSDTMLMNTLAFGHEADASKLEQLASLGRGALLTAVDAAELKTEFSQIAKTLNEVDLP